MLRGGLHVTLLVCAATAAACDAPCGREAFGARAVAHASSSRGHVRGAEVSVTYAPARTHGDGSSSSQVTHRLTVTGDRPMSVQLDTARPATRAQCEQRFSLSIAPDGHAVAVSRDGGKTWGYASFDGPAPIYCAHRPPAAPAAPGDLWAGVPTTKAATIELLRLAGDLNAAVRHAGKLDARFGEELDGAAQFACAGASDPDLAAALGGALDHAEVWLSYRGEHDPLAPLLRCASNMSRGDAALRSKVVAGLARVAADPSGATMLEPYARGCGPGDPPGYEALWCLAKDALAGRR